MARRLNTHALDERKRLQKHGKRQENKLDQRLLIIIACEGEKTERYYFEAWFARLRTSKFLSAQSCVIAPHAHTNPTGVLEDLRFYAHYGITFKDFDQRWIVIDRDAERTNGGGHTLEDFNNALLSAARSRPVIKVAWSNPCFEIWFLLHFRYHCTAIERDSLRRPLCDALGREYEKNDTGLFEQLFEILYVAKRNAKRLYDEFQAQRVSADQSNPCTTVYQLVEALQELGDET